MTTLHERLRWLRKQRGLSLREVAEKSGLGISHISTIERGAALPSLETLEAVAAVYGLTIGEALVGVTIRADE